MKEQEMGLPEGWELKKLKEIITLISGQDLKPEQYSEKEIGIPYITGASNFNNGSLSINRYTNEPSKIALKNDLLLTCKGTVGEMAFLQEEKVHIARQIMAIRQNSLAETQFIYFYLKREIENLKNKAKGLIPGIGRQDLLNIDFPLPPLTEQQHLSQKLTVLLDGVAEAKQRLERIPALLKQFRQSVLADAVSGKLINEEFIEKNTLKDCADILNGARKPISSKEREKIQGIIPYYGATGIVDYLNDFTHNGRFLLVGEDGANLLTKVKDLAYIVEGKVWVNNHAHVLKEKIGFCLDFIKISINALDLSPWVTGSAQPKLTKKALENLPIPKATFEQQTQIIQKVETYFALADKIETEAANALEKVNLLTQSILAKAFRGELSADWRAENEMRA